MKKILFFVLIIFLNCGNVYAFDGENMQSFLNELNTYIDDNFKEFESENILNEIINEGIVGKEEIISKVGNIFLKEIKDAISLVTKILLVTVFCSFLKNIGPQSENTVKEIAFYICYLVIIRAYHKFIYKYQ